MWNPFKSPKVPKGPKQLYDYRLGRRFDPGAMAEVFEPAFSNPVYLFRGAGRVAGQFHTIQPPQVYVNNQAGVNGLGGIQAGQIFSQPLIDPADLNPEGVE